MKSPLPPLLKKGGVGGLKGGLVATQGIDTKEVVENVYFT